MVNIPAEKLPAAGSDERSRVLRDLLYATAMTPIMLFTGLSQGIASVEATVVAVGLGAIGGAVVSLTQSNARFGPQNDLLATIAGVAIIGAVTVLLWLLIPSEHVSTFLYFSIGFLWGAALASAARHVGQPSLGSSDSTE